MKSEILRSGLPLWFTATAPVIAGGISALLGTLVHAFQLPLYLDSILTIIVTLHLGIIPGVVTAIVTNGILALTGQVLFPFVCCNLLTAVATWLFVRHRWLDTAGGFVWLGVTVALLNGFFGSVLAYIIYSGVTSVHGIDRLVMGLMVTGQSLLTAVFWAGMVTNLVDKLVSALIAFISRGWISKRLPHIT